MQLDKSTKKIEQIEKVAATDEQIIHGMSEVIDKFKIRSNLGGVDLVKRSGVLISTITMVLIMLPFLGSSSVLALFKSGMNKVDDGQKDVYYDMKNNSKINWRSILLLMAKRFQYLVDRDAPEHAPQEGKRIKATVFDDSAIEKTGRKIEGVGFIHDHVTNLHILGFKLLVCGFWDGISFIPIDFSLHREKREGSLKKAELRLEKSKGKVRQVEDKLDKATKVRCTKLLLHKEAVDKCIAKPGKTNSKRQERSGMAVDRMDGNLKKIKKELYKCKKKAQFIENEYLEIKSNHRLCGLTEKEIKKQFNKQRDRNAAGYRRTKESNDNKLDVMVKMLKRTVAKGFIPDYVLTDTWFFSYKILLAITSMGKNIKMISMAKIGTTRYNVLPTDKVLNPHQMITLYDRTKGKENKKYKARHIKLPTEYQGIRVNLFLIRFGSHGNWRMLVTSDLSLNFNALIEIYKIRWTIEVFFKECKQHLLLGKSQSLDFDAQIADATLSLIRYILLSYYERIHYGMTIGGLFRQLKQLAIEENILADINLYFFEVLQIFADLAGIDFLTFYEELLRNEKAGKLISKIGIRPTDIQMSNVA